MDLEGVDDYLLIYLRSWSATLALNKWTGMQSASAKLSAQENLPAEDQIERGSKKLEAVQMVALLSMRYHIDDSLL